MTKTNAAIGAKQHGCGLRATVTNQWYAVCTDPRCIWISPPHTHRDHAKADGVAHEDESVSAVVRRGLEEYVASADGEVER